MLNKKLKFHWLGASFGVCFFLLLPLGFASAKTEIYQNNSSYNISVKIALGFKGFTDDKVTALLAYWQQGIDKIWQRDFCSLNFTADLIKIDLNKTCADYPDYDCITVLNSVYNERGNLADVHFAGINNDSQGQWTIGTTDLDAAHEVGHLLGLKDEYHYQKLNGYKYFQNDNLQLDGHQSIMAQTWGDVGALKKHYLEIFNLDNNSNLAYCLDAQNKKEIPAAAFLLNKTGQKIYQQRLAAQDLAGQLVQAETDSSLYFMSDGKLHLLSNQEAAKQLAGADWAKQVIRLNDAIFAGYTFGKNI